MKNKREKGREREKEPQTLDHAARKVCPNDKGISAVIKGTCQISLHSRGSYRMLFVDEGGRRGTERARERFTFVEGIQRRGISPA